jgi:hypothetical protein
MRIIVVAVLACVIQSAKAAEIAVPTAPAPVFVAPDPYPSRFLQQGIFFELGARYWFSSGTFSKDVFGPAGAGLVSRLNYTGLTSQAGELFGSVKGVNSFFLKWNVGVADTFTGTLIDEDFPPGTVPYSRTTSAQNNGSLAYATIDVGYNVVSSPFWQIGPFLGINFLRERMNATGCEQTAGNPNICALPPFTTTELGIQQRADWYSARIGVAGEWNVTNQFKLSGNGAWLPYTSLVAADTHLLTNLPKPTFTQGGGNGVQLEAIASYAISDSFSIGIGGRYWFMQAQGQRDLNPIDLGFVPEKTKTERYGVFLQGAYTFGLPEKARRSPWLSCC